MSMEKATQNELRANLRTIMADRGLKHRDLAEVLGIRTTHVSNRLSAQWFSRDEVQTLADHFDMSVDELMGGSFFKEDARRHNLERSAEIRREHYEKVRAEREAREQAEEAARHIRARSSRALCCRCGALQMIDTTTCGHLKAGTLRAVGAPESKGRWVGRALCPHCGVETDHAVLRDNANNADELEANLRKPTAQQVATATRDSLVARLVGFNIDVRYRRFGRRKFHLKDGVPIISVGYDASKSQWRIEIQRDVPASIQLDQLQNVWEAISTDDKEWWTSDGVSPERGAWVFASDRQWAEVSDDLVDEITSRIGAERELLARDMSDETRVQQSEVS
jgi:predicted XRE-type DNA-binding protein